MQQFDTDGKGNCKNLGRKGIFSPEEKKLMEEKFQLTQREEVVQPIYENDKNVSDTVVQTCNIKCRGFRFKFCQNQGICV